MGKNERHDQQQQQINNVNNNDKDDINNSGKYENALTRKKRKEKKKGGGQERNMQIERNKYDLIVNTDRKIRPGSSPPTIVSILPSDWCPLAPAPAVSCELNDTHRFLPTQWER